MIRAHGHMLHCLSVPFPVYTAVAAHYHTKEKPPSFSFFEMPTEIANNEEWNWTTTRTAIKEATAIFPAWFNASWSKFNDLPMFVQTIIIHITIVVMNTWIINSTDSAETRLPVYCKQLLLEIETDFHGRCKTLLSLQEC